MALVENAVSGVTIADPAWLDGTRVLKEGQILYVRGLAKLIYGDGVTPDGIEVGAGAGGGGTGDAIAFRVIAVEGVDPGEWVQAETAGDTLTLRPLRGMQISPIPGSDTIGIGLPDGGAFGNLPTWTGSAYVPNPPDVAVYEPQEGEISADLLREETRKFWDGWQELDTYLAPTDPADVVIVGDFAFPSMGAAGTGLLRSYPARFPDNNFTAVAVVLRCETVATSGDVVIGARIAALPLTTDTPTFGDQSTIAETVLAAGQFDVTVVIDDLGAVSQGAQFCVEVGRLGSDAGDTCSEAVTVVGTWLVLL